MSDFVPFNKHYQFRKYTPMFDKILLSDISDHAKVLYVFMYRRLQLSCQPENITKFSDDRGVFITMSIMEMATLLNRKKDAANNAKNELINAGWIEKRRRGMRETNLYYVMVPKESLFDGGKTSVHKNTLA